MRRLGMLLLLALPSACSPASSLREAGVKSEAGLDLDGGAADAQPRDRLIQGADRAGRDGQLRWDAAGRDASIGPRRDGGSVRDTWGVDLAARDSSGQDHATPPPGSQSCNAWTDCAPHFGDSNSGYECQQGQCVCDPGRGMQAGCLSNGGQWIAQECFCQYNASPRPGDDPADPNCWWSWHQDPCEGDRWVDTSYWEQQCYCCDEYGYDICDDVYVEDGYWESGTCPDGWWVELCY